MHDASVVHTALLAFALLASVPTAAERPAASKSPVILGAALVAAGTVGSVVTSVLGWKEAVGIASAFAPYGYVLSAIPVFGAVLGVISEISLLSSDIAARARPAAWVRLGLNLGSMALQATGLVLIISGSIPKRRQATGVALEGVSVTEIRDGHQLVLTGSF